MNNVIPLRKFTTGECLAEAKALIDSDETRQRANHIKACGFIADARKLDRKLTQQKIAEALDRSPAWVSILLAWHAKGYITPTAFGPQAKEARAARKEKKTLVATKDGDECPMCNLPAGRDRRQTKIREEKYRAAGLEDRVASINEDQRKELILHLAANGEIEAFRETLGVSWDDLIVKATSTEGYTRSS